MAAMKGNPVRNPFLFQSRVSNLMSDKDISTSTYKSNPRKNLF